MRFVDNECDTYFVRISLAQVTFFRGAAVKATPRRITMNDTRVSSVICETRRRGRDRLVSLMAESEARLMEGAELELTSTGIALASAPTSPSDFLNERSVRERAKREMVVRCQHG